MSLFNQRIIFFHSTEIALLIVTNDMLSLGKGENVFLVLLDLSAAFDTVNHSLLLARLQKSYGIGGTVLQWLNSYFSQRTQSVNINETNSTVRDLPVGVPQGSVVGPVIYLLYTAPLAKVIRTYGLNYHLYADDTQVSTLHSNRWMWTLLNRGSRTAFLLFVVGWILMN